MSYRDAIAIAARSRGTPRVANRLLKRVRDFAEVRMEGVVTAQAAHAALEMLEVDERGLDCARSAGSSRAARSAFPRWLSRSARSRTRSRTYMSPTC